MHEKSVALVEELIHKLVDLDEEAFFEWYKINRAFLKKSYEEM
jgi:hypothetical protein